MVGQHRAQGYRTGKGWRRGMTDFSAAYKPKQLPKPGAHLFPQQTRRDTRSAAAKASSAVYRALLLLAMLSAPEIGAADSMSSRAQQAPSGKAIAFRLDDVQDWWLSDVQQAVIRLFAEKGIRLTLGIIGGYIGEDRQLVDLINGSPLLTLASHGRHAKNGADGRSLLLTQPATTSRAELSQAGSRIGQLFGARPDVYIPHQNEFNDALLRLLHDLGYSRLSSSCRWHDKTNKCKDKCGYSTGRAVCGRPDPLGIVHLPSAASTQWEPVPGKGIAETQEILREIDNSMKKYGFTVVMLHPQDFSGNDVRLRPDLLHALRLLLERLASDPRNFEFVGLDEI